MAKPSHCKGELLAISSGGATHYQCSGLYRALVDFNLGELAEQYCLQAPYRLATLDRLNTGIVSIEDINAMEASGAYAHRDISDVGFGQYLIHRGYVQLALINEVHCGVGFSPDIVRESANVRAQTLSQLSGGHA